MATVGRCAVAVRSSRSVRATASRWSAPLSAYRSKMRNDQSRLNAEGASRTVDAQGESRRLQFGYAAPCRRRRTSRASSGPIGRRFPSRSWRPVDRLDELDHGLVLVGDGFGEQLSGREEPGVSPVRARGQQTKPVDQGLQGRVADAPAAMSSWSERTSKPKPSFRGAMSTSRCVADLMIESSTSEWCPSG